MRNTAWLPTKSNNNKTSTKKYKSNRIEQKISYFKNKEYCLLKHNQEHNKINKNPSK